MGERLAIRISALYVILRWLTLTPTLILPVAKEDVMTVDHRLSEIINEDTNDERSDSIVLVEPSQMVMFHKRLASLNAKAEKFGLRPVEIVNQEEKPYRRQVEWVGRDNDKMLITLRPLRVSDPAGVVPIILNRINLKFPEIRLGNWQVVGKLESLEGSNLSFSITDLPADVEVIREKAQHAIECEHCNTKRRRNDGYVLRDWETGNYKQVGSNCLKDFTGIDPSAVLFMARTYEVISVLEDELNDYMNSGRINAVVTRDYLANVAFLADRHTFVSARKARETGCRATYEEAVSIQSVLRDDHKMCREYEDTISIYREKADLIREWVASIDGVTDFERNVKILLSNDYIKMDKKHLAFSAASIAMYSRLQAFSEHERRPSEHVGKCGDKVSAHLKIDKVISIENHFARRNDYLILMTDSDGNKLKWKTGAAPWEVIEGKGKVMEATLKIKEHDEYKGVKQTAVTHVKVNSWIESSNTHETKVEQMEQPKSYCVSVYLHESGEVRDFTRPVIDRKNMSLEDLGSSLYTKVMDVESTYFVSDPGDEGEILSLHLHDVNGHDPTESELNEFILNLNGCMENSENICLTEDVCQGTEPAI